VFLDIFLSIYDKVPFTITLHTQLIDDDKMPIQLIIIDHITQSPHCTINDVIRFNIE